MKKIFITSTLSLVLILSGCSSNQPKVKNTTPQSGTQVQVNTPSK